MADLDAFYRSYLATELKQRKQKNRLYSLRSFALSLDTDNGFLSRLLNGKALLSLDVADQFSKRLKLDAKARTEFLLSAAEEQKCHALYLTDPTLTDCDPEKKKTNSLPLPRQTRKTKTLSAVSKHSS